MSWDWVDRDLTEWAKRTLPEFLLIAMQDPDNRDECIARTPWTSYVVCAAEVQVDGEASLTGRKSQSFLEFELDIGIRLDIEIEGKDEYWPGVVQMVRFDSVNMTPPIITKMEELPRGVADEVGWYMREGMGRRFLWHALARWHAYAVRKWTGAEPPCVQDPYRHPEPAPAAPPYAPAPAPAPSPAVAVRAPFIGRKAVLPVQTQWTPPTSDDEGAEDGVPKRFRRYPYLPSMLAGIGGPASAILPSREHAAAHPEWFANKAAGEDLALTAMDVTLDRARRRASAYEGASTERQVEIRAGELCEAIEAGDIMRAFAKLDEETVKRPHPCTGRLPLHYCVAKQSKELLQMMIEGRADVDQKDASGQTALMAAAKFGDAALSKVLLDCGADPTVEDDLGRTATDMVKVEPVVEDRPLKNWREKLAGEPAPEGLAKAGSEVRDLIEARERPRRYGALLLSALAQKDHRTAESAIEAGGDVNAVDSKGETPLLLLAKGKWRDAEAVQVRIAEKACRAGAAVGAENAQGNSALHYAAHRGSLALAETLLRLRADASAVNGEGNTALMYAAHGGHEAICTALLEAYSPVVVKNHFGLTAEETAKRRGFKACALLIKAYELAPKKPGDPSATSSATSSAPRKQKEAIKGAFDYSKWNALEKEMRQEEDVEESARLRELQAAARRPAPRLEDLGPEAFGLPPDTPWPPEDPSARKGAFDYSRWDKIVDDIEKRDQVRERYDQLQKNPQYEWRDGQKMQVIF